MRQTVAADFDARAVIFTADIPEGGTAWFMEGDEASIANSTRVAVDAALDALDGRPPLGLLTFDCVARQEVLGRDSPAAVASVFESAGGVPVAGFHTFGEIARVQGINGYHNQTLVVLALS